MTAVWRTTEVPNRSGCSQVDQQLPTTTDMEGAELQGEPFGRLVANMRSDSGNLQLICSANRDHRPLDLQVSDGLGVT